ncbi:hypothetical protein FRC09_014351 [Ceratobasidium sp. 395]|nr:hypothetical protein FRC09_014351 [Ceratobasidium sp. 395]
MGNSGLVYNSQLWEGLPSQTNRYAESSIIPGTVAAARDEDIAPNPNGPDAGISAGWKEYIHPVEGHIYFYNEELRILTDMHIRHDGVLDQLMDWYGILVTLRDQVLPEAAAFDIFLDCSGEEGIVWHYFVDHANQTSCWLPRRTTSDPAVSDVRNVLHCRALLNEEYWTHGEHMLKNENHLASARVEIQAALASSMLDHMTSESSTSRLENLWVDRIAYTHHWRALLRDLIEKRTSPSATLMVGTELLSSVDAVSAGSHGVNAIPWTARDRCRSVGTALHPHHNARRKDTFEEHLSHVRNTGTPKMATKFKSSMGIEEVIKCLVGHGCQDITGDLDLGSASSEPIAWGGGGKIYFAKLRSGTEVAIKCLLNLGHVDSSEKSSKLLKRTAREIYTWSKCDHPGVVRMRGIALFRGQVAMVSEWMQNGSLRSFMRRRSSFDCIQLCVQLAETLEYLHARKIAHGDIKPDNVLMSNNHAPLFTDFGNAFLMYEASLQFSSTTFGTTARYAAPEVLSEVSNEPSIESDIYSFGMVDDVGEYMH